MQRKSVHGFGRVVKEDLQVKYFKGLIGAGAKKTTDWYIEDQCLDVYSDLVLMYYLMSDQAKRTCIFNCQYRIA